MSIYPTLEDKRSAVQIAIVLAYALGIAAPRVATLSAVEPEICLRSRSNMWPRPLAPLDQRDNLAAIAALSQLQPGLPQIVCFDAAFHHTDPAVATAFALPSRLAVEGDSPARVSWRFL